MRTGIQAFSFRTSIPSPPSIRTGWRQAAQALLLGAAAVIVAPQAEAQDTLCLAGCPTGAPKANTTVRHHVIELSNNPVRRYADWVAYQIAPDTIGTACEITRTSAQTGKKKQVSQRNWAVDPNLKHNDTLRPHDFKKIERSQYQRGHQAPLESLCGSPFWNEANYTSNITAQVKTLNDGTWKALETAERKLVTKHGVNRVYSMTGPLYEKPMPRLPHAGTNHTNPSGYWKIIAVRDGSGISAAAFIMNQDTPTGTWYCTTRVALGEVEGRSKLGFFPELDATQADAVRRGAPKLLAMLGCS